MVCWSHPMGLHHNTHTEHKSSWSHGYIRNETVEVFPVHKQSPSDSCICLPVMFCHCNCIQGSHQLWETIQRNVLKTLRWVCALCNSTVRSWCNMALLAPICNGRICIQLGIVHWSMHKVIEPVYGWNQRDGTSVFGFQHTYVIYHTTWLKYFLCQRRFLTHLPTKWRVLSFHYWQIHVLWGTWLSARNENQQEAKSMAVKPTDDNMHRFIFCTFHGKDGSNVHKATISRAPFHHSTGCSMWYNFHHTRILHKRSAQAPNQTHHLKTFSASTKEMQWNKQIEREDKLIQLCMRKQIAMAKENV